MARLQVRNTTFVYFKDRKVCKLDFLYQEFEFEKQEKNEGQFSFSQTNWLLLQFNLLTSQYIDFYKAGS